MGVLVDKQLNASGQRGRGISVFGDAQNWTGHGPEKPDLVRSALNRRLVRGFHRSTAPSVTLRLRPDLLQRVPSINSLITTGQSLESLRQKVTVGPSPNMTISGCTNEFCDKDVSRISLSICKSLSLVFTSSSHWSKLG